ncbi:NmrA/HSCARG family protein [Pedobacter sp. KLB.chiD]|uniref:NmrA/HSCARG family protein n=1 Tax=Pedobacter sp. KLB.chiD TaxID=3387402 RepID=UPI00399968E8
MSHTLSKNKAISPAEKPLVVIVGILGKQGYSVAGTLLASGAYRIRGITRRLNAPEAIRLAEQGVELVSLPLSLGYKKEFTEAFRGAESVFLMTPNIAPPATYEFDLGKELADAAVEAGVQQIIFSSLENVDKLTGGKLFAPHFTDKARVEAYIRKLPVKSSFIYMAFFFTNLMEFYTPKLSGDTLIFPIYLPEDFAAPFVDPLTATGPAVFEILSNPAKYTGQSLPVIGDVISPQEMVKTFTKVTGIKAEYSSAYKRKEMLQHFPEFASNEILVREILGMAEFAVEYGYFSKERNLKWSRQINPGSLNWEAFLRTTKWKGQKWIY